MLIVELFKQVCSNICTAYNPTRPSIYLSFICYVICYVALLLCVFVEFDICYVRFLSVFAMLFVM